MGASHVANVRQILEIVQMRPNPWLNAVHFWIALILP
jgi:hypothetical protein